MFINYEHENHVYKLTCERRNNEYFVTYDNTEYKVEVDEIKPGHLKLKIGERLIKAVIAESDKDKIVFVEGDVYKVKPVELTGTKKKKSKKKADLSSPISGKVVDVKVKKGDKVKKDQVLMVIEAMKMEYLIRAPFKGVVKKVNFKENDQIEIGQNTIDLKKG